MSLKTIVITRWLNYNSKKKYTINIYEDDNIEDGIAKINMIINEELENKNLGRYYVWNNNYKSILYSIDYIKWKGYDYNPLKSIDKNNLIIKQPIIYKFNRGLCYFNSINIIYEKDFPDLKDNQYYFIEKKNISFDIIKKKETKLLELEKKDISAISDNYSIIHRYELSSKLKNDKFLADIYDKLNTSPFIQYIQWVNDIFTLIHKLYLYHTISHTNLTNWTTIDKIVNNKRCINCFSLLSEGSNSYAKITIDSDMKITINYILDLRKNINWEIIDKNLILIKKYLETSLTEKITFNPISIKVHNYISILNVSLDTLKSKISLYPQIFDIISTKETINLIYKRSSNFINEAFDYSKYIKTRLLLGVDNNEIVDELITFGLTLEDAKKQIANEEELLQELEDKLIKEDFSERRLNTIIVIKPNKNGFETIIHNIPNEKECNYLIYWLSKIISLSQELIKNPKKKQIIEKKQTKKISSSSSSSSKNEDINEEDLEKLSSSEENSYGGAKDKDDQRYRIQLLQNADKDLFGENYAREKCQKRNQPYVISAETRQKLINEGKYYVDNDLYYGSKKDKMNYYMCPRLWCKVSKVPADPITGKCPIENDETILSFFDNPNEENVKRYVKLIKPNENNLCVPCCFKKPPKQDELNKCKNYETYNPKNINKGNIDEKDENYLVNYGAPIGIGRYGIVPQNLHEILFPTIKYQNCSKDLTKSEKCLVRKGIIHKDISKEENIYPDSLIYSLTYLLEFKNKKEFINDIKKKLDLITFLSIENGNVCKAFMDKLPLIPDENLDLIIELKEHFDKFSILNKLYKIDFKDFNYKLSRLLGIFKSYKKFIDYISINDYYIPKSPYYLYSLISNIYNKLLIVWEKENKGNITQIICPYFTSYNDLISSLEINPDMIMILKDNKYFEPLELKSKGKEGIKTFILDDYPKLQELLNECSINNIYDLNKTTYNNIYSLNIWTKTKVLNNYKKFIIDTIIINSDLTIEHFLTKGKILITINKIGINFLSRIIKDFDIKDILFYEDLSENNTIFNINVSVKDLELFKEKVISYDIKYDIGILDTSIKQIEPVAEIYTILQLKKKSLSNINIIHTRLEDDLYLYEKDNYENNKKWFQLQLMVFSTLLKFLDENLLKKYQSMSRIDYINELIKLLDKDNNKFKNNPYKNKIRLILEEIPIYSINHIKNYLNKLIIYYKYDFLNPIISINNNQFLFSQVALNNGIPNTLLNYHKSSPYNNFIYSNYDKKDYIFNKDIDKENDIILPELFNGILKKLNSKWIMHKKSKWYEMEIIKIENYTKDYFINFFNWFSNFIKIKTSFNNLQEITNNKLKIIKDDEDNLKNILKDNKLFKLFCSISGKTYTNVNLFWDNVYSNLTLGEKNELINKIISKGYPLNDLYILSMSEILNINILTIHRTSYKTTKDNIIRGDIEDLVLSTTFYKAINNYENRPLIIFYKDINSLTSETIYELVVDKNIKIGYKSIYLKFSEIPQEIIILINEHLKK